MLATRPGARAHVRICARVLLLTAGSLMLYSEGVVMKESSDEQGSESAEGSDC